VVPRRAQAANDGELVFTYVAVTGGTSTGLRVDAVAVPAGATCSG
jgi:hypothetical protein